MPTSQKIITKLRERRQIEADLRQMLTAGSDLELRRQAQQIAALGSQVIPTIVGNLDQADARMLAAMGVVATFLDRDEIVMALRQTVLQPQRTDQGRVAAITILERFLGLPPDDDLLESLANPEGVAVSSLEEVLRQADRSPAVLVEYVQSLDRQEPDVVLAVARALRDMGDGRCVEPLRMMAQDVRDEIAAAALSVLGGIRLPEAARALQTLAPIVHLELRPLAERLIRKQRFAGVEVETLPLLDPNWRALIGPVDGLGQQGVWFIFEDRATAQARFLNILLNDQAGAVEAVGHMQVQARMLPPQRLLGYVHDLPLPDGSGATLMLEVAFDVGRRFVLEALAHNHETQIPVAGVLRLLSPWLWEVSNADSLPPRALPEPAADGETTVAHSDRLLKHPAFATWTVRSEVVLQAAEEIAYRPRWDLGIWAERLAGDLFAEPAVSRMLSQRLEAMSEWLILAGDEGESQLALAASQAILNESPQDVPFVLALIRRDLELILPSLKQPSGPLLGTEELQ